MIKNIFSFIAIISLSLQSFSQVKTYDETALLFSQEKLNGTARYLAMSGAYGAIGGDLSAVDVNPAGMAIFNESTANISFDVNASKNTNKFYNTSSSNEFGDLDFAQAGFLILSKNGNENWDRFSFSINTMSSNDFDNSVSFLGNNHLSNESFFLAPDPTADLYDIVESQKMENTTSGKNAKTFFTIASRYNKNLYFGMSIISNSVDFNQSIRIKESSKDINDNTFNGNITQTLNTYGGGIGFNFGILSKPTKNLRLGLAYQTPSWYALTEDFTEDMTVNLSNADIDQPDIVKNYFEYHLRTPGKVTGSIAYIFGKEGLISLDYNYKDYSDAKLSPTADFEGEYHNNENIKNNYDAVSSINIGGEYRLKHISLRAGYHFEDSPYKNSEDKISGYSLGFGFKTSNYSTLDFAFNKTNGFDKNYYLNAPNAILTENDTNKFTATYSISF